MRRIWGSTWVPEATGEGWDRGAGPGTEPCLMPVGGLPHFGATPAYPWPLQTFQLVFSSSEWLGSCLLAFRKPRKSLSFTSGAICNRA